MDFIHPKRLSEATLQAEFYSECLRQHIGCFLEYTYEDCRFDAVIVYKGKIVFIIEIKSHSRKYKLDEYGNPQIKKYERFNIPVITLTRKCDIIGLVKKINIFILSDCDDRYLLGIKYYRKGEKKSKVCKILRWTSLQKRQSLKSRMSNY